MVSYGIFWSGQLLLNFLLFLILFGLLPLETISLISPFGSNLFERDDVYCAPVPTETTISGYKSNSYRTGLYIAFEI